MKTITIKVVVEDSDEDSVNQSIGEFLEHGCEFPVYMWHAEDSTPEEAEFYREQA